MTPIIYGGTSIHTVGATTGINHYGKKLHFNALNDTI